MKRIVIVLLFLMLLMLVLAACGSIFQSDGEFALFQKKSAEALGRVNTAVTESCLVEVAVPGGRQFPLAEPDYNAKRPRDLSPFSEAMAGFTAEQAGAIESALAGKTIPEIQTLLDNGDFTSEQLVLYYLDRIQRYDIDKLNSVMELNPEALTIARALDEERAADNSKGPLHGIPVLLKDNIATGDQMRTTAGAYALKDWQADRDAFLVKQLRDGGAIIMGKANLSEWANYMDPCMPSGFSAVGGQVRHPYGPFDPLGSSTGSAVSVAAGLTTISVGSETSGSIIQPARVNSVVALRPSQGLVSRDYVIPLGPDLDSPGPMGRSVTDVAIMLTVMAGVDENDAKTEDAASLAGADFTRFLSQEEAQKLRVGVITPGQKAEEWFQSKLKLFQDITNIELSEEDQKDLMVEIVLPELGGDPQVAIDALKAAGIEVVEINDSDLPANVDTAQTLLPYSFQDGVSRFFAGVGGPAPISSLADVIAINKEDMANRAPYDQRFLEWSVETEMTAEEYEQLRAEAQTIADKWIKDILEKYDVDVLVAGTYYAGNAGAAGVPALTIPAGLDPKGQPQGIILSGDYLSEPQLFAVGYALEQVLNGRVEPNLDATMQQIEAIGSN